MAHFRIVPGARGFLLLCLLVATAQAQTPLPQLTASLQQVDRLAVPGSLLPRHVMLAEGSLIFHDLPCTTAVRWDEARGVTVGCLQFGFLGRLQPVLLAVRQRHPALLRAVFGTDAAGVEAMLDLSAIADQVAWARQLADGHGQLRPQWAAEFAALAGTPEFQAAYLESTDGRYQRALGWARRFGFHSRQGVALMFDLALYGGISREQEELLARALPPHATGVDAKEAELSRLWAFAEARSAMEDNASMRAHLEAIAAGHVTLGGRDVSLAEFGITADPANIDGVL